MANPREAGGSSGAAMGVQVAVREETRRTSPLPDRPVEVALPPSTPGAGAGLTGLAAKFQGVLNAADIRINGGRPWDVRVLDERLYRRVLLHGMPGLGDAYADGWWESDSVDGLGCRAIRAGVPAKFRWTPDPVLNYLREKVLNLQRPRPAVRNARRHYNIGNDLFREMLDSRMLYSCGYWASATDLEGAQLAKIDLVCRKLGLAPGMTVLELGCGWGGFARHAAERYGCRVVAVTAAEEQATYAAGVCKGLPVEIRCEDYRGMKGRFDRVASIGMFEHVGQKNHLRFMRFVDGLLADDGLCLLHFFASKNTFPNTRDNEVLWITRHIFPGIVVPSMKQVGRAVDGLFVIEDVHNFGADYDPTLMAWWARFDGAWPRLKDKYGERFYRMWKFYLLIAAGAFRARRYQLWQVVMSKDGVMGGYRSIR